jgi:hypothetical protein
MRHQLVFHKWPFFWPKESTFCGARFPLLYF